MNPKLFEAKSAMSWDYEGLIRGIKFRIMEAERVANAELPFHPRLVEEYLYLQLRMAIEAFAIACLSLHEDRASKYIANEWKPKRIMEELEKVHASFWPIPVRIDDTGKLYRVTGDFLSKDDLLRLWGRTGNELHRGSAKRVLHPQSEIDHRERLQSGFLALWRLLYGHVIPSHDGIFTYFCCLVDHDHNQDVSVFNIGASLAELGLT